MQQSRKRPRIGGFAPEYLNQQCHNGSCPNLAHHRINIGSNETFDLQVLLDFFEKQFNLPTVLVKGGNLLSSQIEVVRNEVKPAIVSLIVPLDQAKLFVSA